MKPTSIPHLVSASGETLSPEGEVLFAIRDQRVALWLGMLTAVAGCVIMFGWIADIPTLKGLFPHQVQAKANTALCFILLGVALALKTSHHRGVVPRGFRLGLANVGAGLATLIGVLTLVQYLARANFGIDELLFKESVGALDTVHPGRMAPPTALSIMLLGSAVLLLERMRDRGLLIALVLPTSVVAGLAFIGHLYDLPQLASFGPFTSIAAPTGLLILILGLGILQAGANRFLNWLWRSAGLLGFVLALLLLAVMGGAVAYNTSLLVDSNRLVNQTHGVLGRLAATRSAMQDVETGSRGYLLTGDRSFLEPFTPAPARTRSLLQELRDLAKGNQVRSARLDRLERLIEDKIAFSQGQVTKREQGVETGTPDRRVIAEGKESMDAVRREVGALEEEERSLLREQLLRVEMSTQKTLLTLGLGLVACVSLLVTVFQLLRREIVQRSEIETALRRSEESLAVTLHSIGDAVLATDTAGRVTRMNQVAEQLTGWPSDEARGRPIAEVFRIINEQTRQPGRIPVDDVLATGETKALANHTVLIARDGTERAIADSAAPIRNASGRVLGVVLVFRDVTTEQAAGKALRESEARYRTLFESIDQGFCIIEMIFDDRGEPVDYRFLETNPAFAKQTGLSDALGKRMRELAPQHEAHWFELYGRVARTGEPIHFQNRAEQLQRTFEVYAFRIDDPKDRKVAILFSDITERQQAEAALRRSEESLAVTLHSIGDAVLATDTAGKITRMNHVAEQLTGWTGDEARGHPIADVFRILNEETRRPGRIPVDEVLATGEIKALANHTVLVARDGTERAIADSAAPIRDADGRILGVVLVFRDVSAERAAEIKLAAALADLARERARLKFIFDSVPIGISFALTEADGRRTRLINDAHLGICGITRSQADEPDTFTRITHPDDRATQERLSRQILDGSANRLQLDKRYVRPDGGVAWVMFSFSRRKFPDGSYEDLSTVVDITERKKAEEELDRFFSLSLDFLCIAGMDGWFKRASPAVTDVLGWTVEEFLAKPYMEQIHPDDRAAALKEVARQQAGQKVMHYECRFRHKDGSWRVLSWRSAPHGDLMYATARDVTELKRTEAQIRQLNDDLARRATQMEEANKELESFSYSVSHDLRAPLRHVQGYVEMLNREAGSGLSAKAQRYLKTITDAAREMGELIDDLLAFSRMGRTEMREAELNLTELIDEVRAGLELATRGRNIRWTVAPLPAARGDAAMLRQVFANLLGNAVKYTRLRDVAEIEIGTAGEEDGRVVIFVRDNGAGFDMKYADKLFGVFQRLHRADEFEGTGIGLASVRRIVTRHGGRIWAEGRVNAGATFYFSLFPAPAVQTITPAST